MQPSNWYARVQDHNQNWFFWTISATWCGLGLLQPGFLDLSTLQVCKTLHTGNSTLCTQRWHNVTRSQLCLYQLLSERTALQVYKVGGRSVSPYSFYGSIQLTHFSGLGIAGRKRTPRSYCAQIYHRTKGVHDWRLYFVVTQDIEIQIKVSHLQLYFTPQHVQVACQSSV